MINPRVQGPGYRIRRVDYAPGYRRRPHAHETTGITLILAGQMVERAHGIEEFASALSVVVKPGGTVHENEAGPLGARTIAVDLLDPDCLQVDTNRLGRWRWFHGGPGAPPLLALGRQLVDAGYDPCPEDALYELLGELTDSPAPRAGDVPLWVRRAREILDDTAPDRIEVKALAKLVGVHPVALTRAFRRAFGIPVTTYRRRVRLRRAADQVTGSELDLSAIAHDSGYADQSHMCREIRSATALTPSSLRHVAQHKTRV